MTTRKCWLTPAGLCHTWPMALTTALKWLFKLAWFLVWCSCLALESSLSWYGFSHISPLTWDLFVWFFLFLMPPLFHRRPLCAPSGTLWPAPTSRPRWCSTPVSWRCSLSSFATTKLTFRRRLLGLCPTSLQGGTRKSRRSSTPVLFHTWLTFLCGYVSLLLYPN